MATGKLIDILDHQVCFMEYSDSAILSFAPQQVFDVVADIEKYPEFLPGWISAAIVERQGNTVQVEQELGFAFLNWRFTSEPEEGTANQTINITATGRIPVPPTV